MKFDFQKINPKNFTKRAKIIFWVVIVVGILLIGFLLFGLYASTKQLEESENNYVVTLGNISQEVTGNGTCSPSNITTLKSAVGAKVNYVNYNAGSIVGIGDTIVQFETTELDYNYDKALIAYDKAKNDYDNATSETRETLGYALDSADIDLDSIDSSYSNYRVTSPINGQVLEVLVSADEFVATGQDVAIVANNSQYEVAFKVDENYINQIAVGQIANISITSATPSEYQGRVTKYSLVGDTSTTGITTYEVTVTFDLPENAKILDGMNANISIVVSEKNDIIVVPDDAIGPNGTVTVIDEEGNTQEVNVELGISDNNNVEIVSGLNVGDVVVLNK